MEFIPYLKKKNCLQKNGNRLEKPTKEQVITCKADLARTDSKTNPEKQTKLNKSENAKIEIPRETIILRSNNANIKNNVSDKEDSEERYARSFQKIYNKKGDVSIK